MKKYTIIIFAILFIVSCNKIKRVKPEEIKCYGSDPLSNTAYIGSDSEFHYFTYFKGKFSGKWKVSKKDLILNFEFPYNKGGCYILRRDKSGKLKPIIIEKTQNEVASPNGETAGANSP